MARIRKAIGEAKNAVIWKTAIYIRLSREDGNDESYSVTNQKNRLTAFVESLMIEEKIELIDIYIDDGYTGTDSNRDGFRNLLNEIDKKNINCVIVKDLSRLSRNDWECKKYIQDLFVVNNVRFISLELPKLDSYRNPDDVYEMGVSIQSMYNENHCRETSVKVRGTFDAKRKKGEFIGAFAPYGYKKNPQDKHRLIIDDQTDFVVRDIFHWFVRDGMSKNAIVRKLVELGIPSPAAYKHQNGMKYFNPAILDDNPSWSTRSITNILTNRMYLGHMVQGKQRVKSYKIHTRINIPPQEWIVVENTHEPIIDTEIFNLAQELMLRDTRTSPGKNNLYPFSGFLRCADCNRAMVRKVSRNTVYYICKTHAVSKLCPGNSIRNDKLEKIVLTVIQKQIALIEDIGLLINNINESKTTRDTSSQMIQLLRAKKQEIEKISNLKTCLYLDWKNGDISRNEYHKMKKKFEDKEQQIAQNICSFEKEAQTSDENKPVNLNLKGFLEHGNIQSLNRGIIAELIKVIYVNKNNGLVIDFNFADPYSHISELIGGD